MEDTTISAFFDALIDDEIEREIIRLMSEDLDPEEILEKLLSISSKKGKK